MKTFHARPVETAAFLSKQLRPIIEVEADRGKRFLADLDSEDFAVRERAGRRLAKWGDSAEPLLIQALRSNASLELRRRAEGLLEELATEHLRAGRALEVLEWLNTPESRRLLGELARGAPDAWLTREAKAALERRAIP
jgi:hypothetical protein